MKTGSYISPYSGCKRKMPGKKNERRKGDNKRKNSVKLQNG